MIQTMLGDEWYNLLKDEFDKEYMQKLQQFVKQRRSVTKVYPESNDVFNAYKLTPYSKIKVVIIGQDPYINGEAHGLAFSGKNGVSTPSLAKMAEAVNTEVWDNDLTRWAEQGVFLINSVLTVDAKKSASHANQGWERFVYNTIKEIDKKGNIIFMLWGGYARTYDAAIAKGINNVIMCEHPVYASYQRRKWLHNDCFNKCNQILNQLGEKEIKW